MSTTAVMAEPLERLEVVADTLDRKGWRHRPVYRERGVELTVLHELGWVSF